MGSSGGYMRLGLAAALSLVMAAVFASHLVDRARTHHIQRRMEVSDALGAALGAVTEQGVLLAALREVAFERLAADERTALLLDPLASPDEFAFIARAVAERPEPWGKPWPPTPRWPAAPRCSFCR